MKPQMTDFGVVDLKMAGLGSSVRHVSRDLLIEDR